MVITQADLDDIPKICSTGICPTKQTYISLFVFLIYVFYIFTLPYVVSLDTTIVVITILHIAASILLYR